MRDGMVETRMTSIEASAAAWSADADLDGAIVDLVERGAVVVPPFPTVAGRVERLISGGDWAVGELLRLVGADPALAGAALAAAPGAASIEEAAGHLGPHGLARAAVSAIREAGRSPPGPLAPLRRAAWCDAVSAAALCRDLARVRGLHAETAHACGLLHDVGRLFAIALLERIAQGARADHAMPMRWWEAVVERYHVRLGIALADRWGLSPVLRDAVALHHGGRPAHPASAGQLAALSVTGAVVRVLADQGRVAEEDAAAIRALDQGDADALARTVDRLPRLLAALEGEASCSSSARKHPARVRPRGVRIRIADTLYEATGFAAHQIVARGDVPLPEELLLEVELVSDPPTRFHARVLLCWPEDGRFGVVLVPFALTGPALLHWQGLVARATAS
ncbi:MAG TPA: HDOD domain-containing protein [Anaeromyxobacteraceae bacterium]|nr:HDOD domain-containing protein [Anaeromyxobacteraceae bacterium]